MGSKKDITIIHFNDVYNIEPQKDEPKGGAARMAAYIKSCQDLNPLVLFSGDILNPSLMSIFMKGNQMIPVINELNVQCAVLGNHDFDFGVDHLEEFISKTKCPWLLSNVKDNLTDKPLAEGKVHHILQHNGIKIGLIGLVEDEWIETLATLDPEDVTFEDYVEKGKELARYLKQQGVDLVIALTHMRWPNDRRLAESVEDIDLILGGHDHDYNLETVNGKYIVKSGTDFRNLSKVTISFSSKIVTEIDIQRVDLDSSFPEDPDMKKIVASLNVEIDKKMGEHLGHVHVEMDGRFQSIRSQETNLGNFVTDIMLEVSKADLALLNSGTFRSDRIHPKGDFKLRDLLTILPLVDPLVVIEVKGSQLIEALENGVSKYPSLEGRFPQVAGATYGFDPTKPPGERVDEELVQVQDQYIRLNKNYRLCTKEYIADGKDGYDVFKKCPVVVDSETMTTLSTAVRNHFESVQIVQGVKKCKSGHRQSLISLVRRDSLMKQTSLEWHVPHQLVRQMSVHEVECEKSYICPKVEGRIFQYNDEKRMIMKMTKVDIRHNLSDEEIPEEGEEEEVVVKDEALCEEFKQKQNFVDIHTI